jgi:hypothetical protein
VISPRKHGARIACEPYTSGGNRVPDPGFEWLATRLKGATLVRPEMRADTLMRCPLSARLLIGNSRYPQATFVNGSVAIAHDSLTIVNVRQLCE